MTVTTLLHEIGDPASRADPYHLYAEFEDPVTVQDDGSYVVSSYEEIVRLLHDPRISSDQSHRTVPPSISRPSRRSSDRIRPTTTGCAGSP